MLLSRRLPRLVAVHLLPCLRQQQYQAVAFTAFNTVATINSFTCPAAAPASTTSSYSTLYSCPAKPQQQQQQQLLPLQQTCAMSSSTAAAATDATEQQQPPTAAATKAAAEEKPQQQQQQLPPLSAAEFRVYNRMAEHMDMYHAHFRQSWNLLWNAATSGTRPSGMSIRAFIMEGLQFLRYLTVHHDIEETHIFPVLAKKMPEFQSGAGKGNKGKGGKGGGGGAAELLRQHQQIHSGMDLLQAYLTACRAGEADLEMRVLKDKMEPWADVLWTHLDQEVETLGAENMRKYWTPEEMRRLPM